MSENESAFMRRAIELSKRGFPAPNPRVGCVIVKQKEIVGEGYHDHQGGEHAEAMALRMAGDRAVDSDVYVTLEPCTHFGRTPPCADALIKAKARRVFIACMDPNPRAAGGARRLSESGIEVLSGVLVADARNVNRIFLHAHETGKPLVVAKAAITLDGYLAREDGSSKWITGEAARAEGHRLRAELGAVLVGRRTVELDDPQLTARIDGVVNQPKRIVLDSHRSLSAEHNVFRQPGEALRVVEGVAQNENEIGLPDPTALDALLEALRGLGVIGVLVEGGAATLTTFFQQGLIDELHLFVAPKLYGTGIRWIKQCQPMRAFDMKVQRLGEDAYIFVNFRGQSGTV